jgi:pimeloyl-ACP methyl ester carboxylesterase
MKKILLFIFFLSFQLKADDFVVCIHGFMGGKWCMSYLEKNLLEDGWEVVNWDYPSRDDTIQNHGEKLTLCLKDLARQKPGRPIHFVTHSMGSLVLLAALNQPEIPLEAKTGRLVLIAPPLKGSLWARWIGQFELIRKILKEYSGKELMTETNYFETFGDFPESIQKILVIAGSFGFNPILDGENDGTIAVTETFLNKPHEHIVVKSGHKTIVFNTSVSEITKAFLLEN